MSDLTNCPHCDVSLLGTPIPEEYQKEYYGGSTHYKREVGVEVSEVYDGMLYYFCPDCGGKWHRFPEGHYLRTRAEPYVSGDSAPDFERYRENLKKQNTFHFNDDGSCTFDGEISISNEE